MMNYQNGGGEDEDNFDIDLLNDVDGDGSAVGGPGGAGGTAKESTGRWTREEHQLFVKGLEMYGKGWKKIASLIKTRTVVQIRTHAQKYFLKLTKARQSGELNGAFGPLSADGRPYPQRRRKRKRENRPIGLAPALAPFVTLPPAPPSLNGGSEGKEDGGGEGMAAMDDRGNTATAVANNSNSNSNSNSSEHRHYQRMAMSAVHEGLHSFLSPVILPPSSSSTANEGPPMKKGSSSATAMQQQQQLARDREADSSNSSGQQNQQMKAADLRRIKPPKWFVKGGDLQSLLKEAEGLDWGSEAPPPPVSSIGHGGGGGVMAMAAAPAPAPAPSSSSSSSSSSAYLDHSVNINSSSDNNSNKIGQQGSSSSVSPSSTYRRPLPLQSQSQSQSGRLQSGPALSQAYQAQPQSHGGHSLLPNDYDNHSKLLSNPNLNLNPQPQPQQPPSSSHRLLSSQQQQQHGGHQSSVNSSNSHHNHHRR